MNSTVFNRKAFRDHAHAWMTQLKQRKYKSYQEIEQLSEELQKEHDQQPISVEHADDQKRIRKFWLVGVVVVLLGYFLFQSLTIIYLIVAAFIISMAMNNMVEFFHRGMPRGLAIGLAYVLLLLFVLSGVVIVVPFVVQQIADIINLLLDKVYDLQLVLQTQGIEQTILSSRLPL